MVSGGWKYADSLVVVEADHLHLVGHGNAVGGQRRQRAHRKLVVQCDHSVERHAGIDDALHIARARADRPIVADVGHQLSGKRDIAVTARFEHAAHTKLRVAFRNITQSRKLREISARADHRRPADATVKQIFRGETRALHVVRCDVVRLVMRESRATQTSGKSTDRSSGGKVLHFGQRQDHAVGNGGVEVAQERGGAARLPSAYVVTYTGSRRCARCRSPDWRAPQDRGAVRHGTASVMAGPPTVEVAGGHVDAIAEPIHDFLHFFACGVGHTAGVG